jgi:hypothetical protein
MSEKAMHVTEIYNHALHHLSAPRFYKPVLTALIPIVTQLLYKKIRSNMYQNANNFLYGDNLFEVYQEGQPLRKQRDYQHKIFLIIAATQAVAFFALALRSRNYLFPAVYTLAHLIWTNISKSHECIKQETSRGQLKPVAFSSMDGEIPFETDP